MIISLATPKLYPWSFHTLLLIFTHLFAFAMITLTDNSEWRADAS